MCESSRWTRKDHEEIEVYGGLDRLHPAPGRGRRSEATYYNWRKNYGGLMPSEFEEERGKLKKIVADLSVNKGDAAGPDPPKALNLSGSGNRWIMLGQLGK
jgi:hypothetical protein